MASVKQLERLRKVLGAIRRDADGLEDYEAGDSIGRSATYALDASGDELQIIRRRW